ncbi:MAG: DUF1819 family protein [Saprospirales bacterium]|nr:MAG: DUF1819 family protein [Saprospirales bacterium]
MTPILPYTTSFTAVGLAPEQFLAVCRMLDKNGLRADIPLDATESIRTNTHKRKVSEFVKRWKSLSEEEKQILFTGDPSEIRAVAFLATVKTYKLIGRFVIEVLWRINFSIENEVTLKDYDNYFDEIAVEYPAMRNMAEGTYKKARSRIFNILRDGGILVGRKKMVVTSAYPGKRLVEYLNRDHPHHLKFFLLK